MVMIDSAVKGIKEPSSKIYIVRAHTYFSKATHYPVKVRTVEIGSYSTLENAEAAMRSKINPIEPEDEFEKLHSWSIQEIGIDVPHDESYYDERIYDDLGNLRGIAKNWMEPFFGVDHDQCRYREGDFVEFLWRDRILFGIIEELALSRAFVEEKNTRLAKNDALSGMTQNEPRNQQSAADQSDNTYRIIYGENICDDIHLAEAHLFPPRFQIPVKRRERLIELFRYENGVYRRFEEAQRRKLVGGGGIELNTFLLDSLREPRIVVHDGCEYLVLSLESLTFLRGKQEEFDHSELKAVVEYASEHKDELTAAFKDMQDEYTKRVSPTHHGS